MYERDRLASLVLFCAALGGWLAVAWVLLNLDPAGSPGVLLTGALALGLAVSLTLVPVFFLLGFVFSRRIAYRGDWWRALRRGVLVGLLVSIFVVLRGQEMLSAPLALFVLTMGLLVEAALSLRR